MGGGHDNDDNNSQDGRVHHAEFPLTRPIEIPSHFPDFKTRYLAIKAKSFAARVSAVQPAGRHIAGVHFEISSQISTVFS